jgi:predicted  nucleic acid-binding Zn-ribbon protein
MTDQANKSDLDRLIADIEVLDKFVQNFKSVIKSLPPEKQDDRFYRLALQVSGIKFPRIISEIINLHSSENLAQSDFFNREELLDKDSPQLAALKKEIELRDAKIQEFKLSLADSVIDFKNLQKQNNELSESTGKLKTQISHMQMHTKDLSLKLESTEKNYTAVQGELKKASEELDELRGKSYSLKSRNADLEDQVSGLSNQLERVTTELKQKTAELDKLRKAYNDLKGSFDHLKLSNSATEDRLNEMESFIDSLQKEKTFLQNKINGLLTGMARTVEYSSSADQKSSENQIFEPTSFRPYLPFCFPERVPNIIKFRRQIKQSFAREFPKHREAPPRAFPQEYELKLGAEHTRVYAFKPEFDFRLPESFNQVLSEPKMVKREILLDGHFELSEPVFAPEAAKESVEAFRKSLEKYLLRTTAFFPKKRLYQPENPAFGIFTNSFDLLLSYLSRDIISANNHNLKHQTDLFDRVGDIFYKKLQLEISNIFNEKLALRYGFQLKSHKLNLHREDFAQSFRKQAGLKSVLETFGNTLNSMVKKYDLFSSKNPGKSES